jgi:hypothetical protein
LSLQEVSVHVYEGLSDEDEWALARKFNEANQDFRRLTFVDDAEFISARLAEGKTQQQIADFMGWGRSQVAQYSRLSEIDRTAWQMIVTTFEGSRNNGEGDPVTDHVTAVASPFTEYLLRDIVPLTHDQQRELVQDLVKVKIDGSSSLLVTWGGELAEAPGHWSGIEGWQVSEKPPAGLFRADPKRGGQKTLSCSPKLTMSQIDKAKFRSSAEKYRGRNELLAEAKRQLKSVPESYLHQAQAVIHKGVYDKEWQAQKLPGPALLLDSLRKAYQGTQDYDVIRGDFS